MIFALVERLYYEIRSLEDGESLSFEYLFALVEQTLGRQQKTDDPEELYEKILIRYQK